MVGYSILTLLGLQYALVIRLAFHLQEPRVQIRHTLSSGSVHQSNNKGTASRAFIGKHEHIINFHFSLNEGISHMCCLFGYSLHFANNNSCQEEAKKVNIIRKAESICGHLINLTKHKMSGLLTFCNQSTNLQI